MNDSKRSQVNSAISMLKTMLYQLQALELEGAEVASSRLTTLSKEADATIDIIKKVLSDEGGSSSNVPSNLHGYWLIEKGHVGDLNRAKEELEVCKRAFTVLEEDLANGIYHQNNPGKLIMLIRNSIEHIQLCLSWANEN